jgi:hypothetical protein
MQATATAEPPPNAIATRVLIVADWKADPRAVVAACQAEFRAHASAFDLIVPGSLHGIDWAGDPFANMPCARRALAELELLLTTAGVPVQSSAVGDHDPVAAILDAVLSSPVDRLLVCALRRRVAKYPFDLAHRAHRATGLPVVSVFTQAAAGSRRHVWTRLRRGECGVPRPQPAA